MMRTELSYPEAEPQELKINSVAIAMSEHALDRFKQRWKPLDEFDLIPENDEEWREKLETLIRDSDEVDLRKVVAVKRLIDSNGKDARYFYNKTHDLRFVVREENGSLFVLTVEEPLK